RRRRGLLPREPGGAGAARADREDADGARRRHRAQLGALPLEGGPLRAARPARRKGGGRGVRALNAKAPAPGRRVRDAVAAQPPDSSLLAIQYRPCAAWPSSGNDSMPITE